MINALTRQIRARYPMITVTTAGLALIAGAGIYPSNPAHSMVWASIKPAASAPAEHNSNKNIIGHEKTIVTQLPTFQLPGTPEPPKQKDKAPRSKHHGKLGMAVKGTGVPSGPPCTTCGVISIKKK